MSKWPMRGHFRYLRFKTFSMTPRTHQCEDFWALLSNFKHLGVPEDSKAPPLGVLGFTPTLGQSGVATKLLLHTFIIYKGILVVEGGKLSQIANKFDLFSMCKPTLTWSIIKPFACIVTNCHSSLAYWLFKLMKYSPTFTLNFAIAFHCPSCFYKPSNFRTNNLFIFLIKLQTLHFMDSLPLGPITTYAQNNFVTQINSVKFPFSLLGFL
jgi:hypothetical protein